MIKHILKIGITLIACNALAYAPLLRAEQLSLPSGDLIAPEITQDTYEETVSPGSDHAVTVKVIDNIGVQQVTLYYRVIGKGDYKRRSMQQLDHSDNYTARVNADEIKAPGIEYYIQAMDHAGNTLLHGHSFSPLSVKIGGTPTEPQIADTSKAPPIATKAVTKEGISNWWWVALGVLLVGAAAGGGSDDDTATLTITTNEP